MVGFMVVTLLLALGTFFVGWMAWGINWTSTETGDILCNYTVTFLSGMTFAYAIAAKVANKEGI